MRRPAEFQEAFSKGNRNSCSIISVWVYSKPNLPTKVGFSVGKRIGNSVKRNLVKRRLKASLKNLLPSNNWVLIVSARPPIIDVKFQTLVTELNDLLIGAGIVFEGDM